MVDPLVGMAVLKVNYDSKGADLIDVFAHLVADRLNQVESPVVSSPEVAEAVYQKFGLRIPGNVVQTVLGRACRRGWLVRRNNTYEVVRNKLASFDLTATLREQELAHHRLVARGREFAEEFFETSLSADEFDAALLRLIDAQIVPMLTWAVGESPIVDLPASKDEHQWIISQFILKLLQEGSDVLEYLATLVRGSLLASVLWFEDIDAIPSRTRGLKLVLDTTVVLRLIGACGPVREQYTREFASLARSAKIELGVFPHTIKEISGVLSACEAIVRRKTGTYVGEAANYMVAAGWEPSDVVLLRDSLEERLRELGVAVVETPKHAYELTLDEAKLEKMLDKHVKYRNPGARNKDIDSLTAIHRLRSGRTSRSIERASAIFVTTNSSMARAAAKFYRREEAERGDVPLAMLDHAMTTYLWLKRGGFDDSFARNALAVGALAAAEPEDLIWKKYAAKIEELRESGGVTVSDYVTLRQSTLARSLILFTTKSKVDAFTQDTVQFVLRHARENEFREMDERLAEQINARAESEARAEEAEARAASEFALRDKVFNQQWAALEGRAAKLAKRWVFAARLFLAAVLLAAIVVTGPWMPSVSESALVLRFLWIPLSILLIAFSWLALLNGATVERITGPLEIWLKEKVVAGYRRDLAAPADPED